LLSTKMLRSTFLVLAFVALAVQAKSRRGPLPIKVAIRLEHLDFEDNGKIVGGHAAKSGDAPFQVAMVRASGHSLMCGGAILDENTVLTAGHCCQGLSSAVLIDYDFLDWGQGAAHKSLVVDEIVPHENYNAGDLTNDICLVHVRGSFVFGIQDTEVKALSLPTVHDGGEDTSYVGKSFIVSGYGTTSAGGSLSGQLMLVETPYVSDEECDGDYSGGIFDSMICAGEAGIDSCQGDSGGPMFMNDASKTHVGIVSWGVGCGYDGYPGVYTQTSYFIDWIANNNNN
jgi:trypsin